MTFNMRQEEELGLGSRVSSVDSKHTAAYLHTEGTQLSMRIMHSFRAMRLGRSWNKPYPRSRGRAAPSKSPGRFRHLPRRCRLCLHRIENTRSLYRPGGIAGTEGNAEGNARMHCR